MMMIATMRVAAVVITPHIEPADPAGVNLLAATVGTIRAQRRPWWPPRRASIHGGGR
jgi:hypothetical protein